MQIIKTGFTVTCMAVIIVECMCVTGQEETIADRLRFFFFSLFRPQTSSASSTPSVSNSYNTYLTILNSANTSGIAITPRLRISRKPEGVAHLQFLDDKGEPSQSVDVPENYYETLANIMQTFKKLDDEEPVDWPMAETVTDDYLNP